jgi:hypothetical protein
MSLVEVAHTSWHAAAKHDIGHSHVIMISCTYVCTMKPGNICTLVYIQARLYHIQVSSARGIRY